MPRWSMLIALLLISSGCSPAGDSKAEDDPPLPTVAGPVAIPLKAYKRKDLIASMPAPADLPGGTKRGFECPGDDECPAGPTADGTWASVVIELKAPDGAGSAHMPDSVWVRIENHDDPTSAAESVKIQRNLLTEKDGAYNIPRKDLEGGSFTPGVQGVGSLSDSTRLGLPGYGLTTRGTVRYDEPGYTNHAMSTAEIMVQAGTLTIRAKVTLGGARGDGAARRVARSAVEHSLDSLA